jgi:hypothetical protein
MRLKRPSPSMIVAIAALVLAAGGFAVAAIPSRDGTIHACYKTKGGDLRIVKGATCKQGERALSWNRGVAAVTVRRGSIRIHRPCKQFGGSYVCTGTNTATVHCKAGERATGGGYSVDDPYGSVQTSRPFPAAGRPTGWTVRGSSSFSGTTPAVPDATIPIYAVCAN